MSFTVNLNKILQKYKDLETNLSSGGLDSKELALISKEYFNLKPIVDKINHYLKAQENKKYLQQVIDTEQDLELKAIAEAELYDTLNYLPELEGAVKASLLPKDSDDHKNAIIEVRAGTGGDEAALFAASLFQMYHRYAERRKWKFELLSISDTEIGGYKEACAVISGSGVFAHLKFESGVHRVQRIPKTESNGRIHTSAATVVVLPEAEEVDIKIDEKDLKIDTYRASGAGGQHVNTTDSAVRITHIPTGVVVSQQDEKSQHKNKAKAMKILYARLYALEKQKNDQEQALLRKGQVGTGDRSERIRTYNYPQGRVTDHRINLTLYKIEEIIQEGKLDEIINNLISENEAKKIADSDIQF
ncbi:peptide chain release factor 1 [Orientia chuto str. Dubai]|uniref:Peptide chain release factor 1 n=1 Tax=Orientia chuto str. Dubai TaxID=1359168 RepID=A0A0F3MIM1_9RICK|nr:peptide chain release factor 1 [Candidatus Orientia mediorientalis]KJV55580.1 peptide chain release factor 1 [Orientia chuto str. Dubai]